MSDLHRRCPDRCDRDAHHVWIMARPITDAADLIAQAVVVNIYGEDWETDRPEGLSDIPMDRIRETRWATAVEAAAAVVAALEGTD